MDRSAMALKQLSVRKTNMLQKFSYFNNVHRIAGTQRVLSSSLPILMTSSNEEWMYIIIGIIIGTPVMLFILWAFMPIIIIVVGVTTFCMAFGAIGRKIEKRKARNGKNSH
jgi:Zn-dependent membrane protease YugP